MKIHLPTPYAPVIVVAPSKPMTDDWMTELEAQVELTKAAQRRRIQEQRARKLPKDEERTSDQENSEPRPRAPRGKCDFLA
jgi:hypothetical protein